VSRRTERKGLLPWRARCRAWDGDNAGADHAFQRACGTCRRMDVSTPAQSPHSACQTGPDTRAIRTSLPRAATAAMLPRSGPYRSSSLLRTRMWVAGNRPPARTTATRCRRTAMTSSSPPIRMRGRDSKGDRSASACYYRAGRGPFAAGGCQTGTAETIRAASLPTHKPQHRARTARTSNVATKN
jgi:hypothetical protein